MTGVSYDYQQILENKFEKGDVLFYLRTFAPIIFFQLIMIGMIIYIFARGSVSGAHTLLYLFAFVMCDVVLFMILISKRKQGNTRLNSDIAKFGKDNLLADLNDPYNEVFCLHKDRYDTYIVISSKYVYFSKTAIYPIDQIKKIYIDINDNSYQIKAGGGPTKEFDPNNLSARNVVRFCKPVYITMADGIQERRIIGLFPEDLERVNTLFQSMGE